ncbi:MAG TPA: hypothetical protein VJ860_19410 [Polyangia bacterium]|jgi:hypothetical protein|nr:hypothetical protein [Polyangia bacterium]
MNKAGNLTRWFAALALLSVIGCGASSSEDGGKIEDYVTLGTSSDGMNPTVQFLKEQDNSFTQNKSNTLVDARGRLAAYEALYTFQSSGNTYDFDYLGIQRDITGAIIAYSVDVVIVFDGKSITGRRTIGEPLAH